MSSKLVVAALDAECKREELRRHWESQLDTRCKRLEFSRKKQRFAFELPVSIWKLFTREGVLAGVIKIVCSVLNKFEEVRKRSVRSRRTGRTLFMPTDLNKKLTSVYLFGVALSDRTDEHLPHCEVVITWNERRVSLRAANPDTWPVTRSLNSDIQPELITVHPGRDGRSRFVKNLLIQVRILE